MKKVLCSCFVIAGLIGFNQGDASGQNSTMGDIHLFQSFFRDTPISETGYRGGLFRYDNYVLAKTIFNVFYTNYTKNNS